MSKAPVPPYHFNMAIIKRSKKQDARDKAAYNSGTTIKKKDKNGRENIVDYTKKNGIFFSKILSKNNHLHFALTREDLWNAVELNEIRKDAQIAWSMIIALPKMLNDEEQISLVEDFLIGDFVSDGYVCDYSIHHDDLNNPHVHVLVPMRRIADDGKFSKKDRSRNTLSFLQNLREKWESAANKHLEKFHVRIDCRSNKVRGIKGEPTVHRGPKWKKDDEISFVKGKILGA